MLMFWVAHLFFLNGGQHGFSLLLVTSALLSTLCCYSLGSVVMTAFTHNVCALFCKSMVVDVCLLLMYIHYETCLRHSMSLSESEYMRKKGESSVIKTRHIQEVWELFLLELIANQSPYVLRRCNQIGLCVHVCVCV